MRDDITWTAYHSTQSDDMFAIPTDSVGAPAMANGLLHGRTGHWLRRLVMTDCQPISGMLMLSFRSFYMTDMCSSSRAGDIQDMFITAEGLTHLDVPYIRQGAPFNPRAARILQPSRQSRWLSYTHDGIYLYVSSDASNDDLPTPPDTTQPSYGRNVRLFVGPARNLQGVVVHDIHWQDRPTLMQLVTDVGFVTVGYWNDESLIRMDPRNRHIVEAHGGRVTINRK